METTLQYDVAKLTAEYEVTINVCSDQTPNDNQLIRVYASAGGAEFGAVCSIQPGDSQTIGQCVDLAIGKLLATIAHQQKRITASKFIEAIQEQPPGMEIAIDLTAEFQKL